MTVRTGVALLLACGFACAHAQVVRQVTDLRRTDTTEMALSDDGSVGFFVSNATPDATWQLFRWTAASGLSEPITNVATGVEPTLNRIRPSVTGDGSRVVVAVDRRPAILNADGSGLTPLTVGPADPSWLTISGSGNRVVFESQANLTGSNPAGATQVFVVEPDGTGLRQVSSEAGSTLRFPTVSDDGVRVAFVTGKNPGIPGAFAQVAGVNHDGTGFRFLTTVPQLIPMAPRISGNGQSVAYATASTAAGCSTGYNALMLVDWLGGSPVMLRCPSSPCTGSFFGGRIEYPDITDDAQTIVYAALDSAGFGCREQVFRVQRDGTGLTDLTQTGAQPGPEATCAWFTSVSGSGSRISYTCRGGDPWGGSNPDRSREAYAASSGGTGHTQVSSTLDGNTQEVDVTADGSTIVFVSNANPTGAPGIWLDEIYRSAADGTGVVRLTSFGDWLAPPRAPTVSDDGNVIAFQRGNEVYSVRGDGGELRALPTAPFGFAYDPHVSPNGTLVVYVASGDPLGETGVTGSPLYRVAPDGTGLARISSKTGSASHPRIDATGTWVAYRTHEGSTYQVRRQRLDGTQDQLVGSGGDGYSHQRGRVDLSSGGAFVVYDANTNPVGQNADGNSELFLWDASTSTTRQLTQTQAGQHDAPRISRDGAWVYFWSDSPAYGAASSRRHPYRLAVTSGVVQPIGGMGDCAAYENLDRDPTYASIAIDGAGRRAFLVSQDACVPSNADGSAELFVTDYTVAPKIVVSGGVAPTVLSWDVEPGVATYDVVRGDVASLGFNGDATVDLGDVVCVENDSLDNSTANAPDPDTPPPGQVFFYLYRGGAGSYGTASGGGERVPGSGGCAD